MTIALLNPTAHALIHTLSESLGVGVEPGKAALKFTEKPLGDITACVELVSNRFHASLAIAFNEQTILSLTQNLTQESHLSIDETVISATSEVAVMIAGEAKRRFINQGHAVILKHPTIHVGYDAIITHPIDTPKFVFPINTEDGIVFLEICVQELRPKRGLFTPSLAA